MNAKQTKIVAAVACISLTAAAITGVVFAIKNRRKKINTNMIKSKEPKELGEAGKRLIKRYEGLRLDAYQCQAGVWTIGYGHTRGVKQGDHITQAQADAYFDEDVKKFVAQLNAERMMLNQNQFDALVSFVFNCGINAFRTSTLKKRIEANDTKENIRAAFLMWRKAGGVVSQGLINRRNAEADLFFLFT